MLRKPVRSVRQNEIFRVYYNLKFIEKGKFRSSLTSAGFAQWGISLNDIRECFDI